MRAVSHTVITMPCDATTRRPVAREGQVIGDGGGEAGCGFGAGFPERMVGALDIRQAQVVEVAAERLALTPDLAEALRL